jgi:hypothetical protein
MIVTDRFVFLHLHKSGGTFVNHWLAQYYPGARTVGYHLPRALIPPEHAALPMIGLVRNPWSYYVSWFSFQAAMKRPNVLFRILSDDGRLGFEPTIRAMLELESGGPHLDAILAGLPREYGRKGINLPSGALADIRDSGFGFYSFLYRYMHGDDGRVGIARMEHLRSELLALIEQAGANPSTEAREALAYRPPANRSNHRPYSEYYSETLRDLVAERDRRVIERHGYSFDG